MYRQGDLLFALCASIPKDATLVSDGVIARGEASGHAHRLQNQVLLMAAGVMYIRALQQAMITHEEHGTVMLPPGNYLVKRQREYEPAGWRQVND
jgi:hypothetical protein